MLRMPVSIVITLILAVAIASAGCGGTDGANGDRPYTVDASTTMLVTDITKAQFVAYMNKVCRQAWITITDNFAKHRSWQDPTESEKDGFADAVRNSLMASIIFHIFDDIRVTGAPPGDARRIERIIGPFQEAAEKGQKEYWTAYSIDEVTVQFETYNRRAQQYGLSDCLVSNAHLRPIESA